MGTGKDFTLYALREGEVKFKVGVNKKKFVTVVDAVDRRGREDGQPTRKEKRRETYAPRAVVRASRRAWSLPPSSASRTRDDRFESSRSTLTCVIVPLFSSIASSE